MKKSIHILVIALILAAYPAPSTLQAAIFSDTERHWAKTEIEKSYQQDLMVGTGFDELGQKTFSPEGLVDRAQLSAVIARVFQLESNSSPAIPAISDYYSDVSELDWYAASALLCAVNEIFDLNGSFKGNETTSRIEVALSIYRAVQAKKLIIPTIMMMPQYDDINSLTQEQTNAVIFVSNTGIMQGNDNNFRPHDSIKRSELARVLNCCYDLVILNLPKNNSTSSSSIKLETAKISNETPAIMVDIEYPQIIDMQQARIQTEINRTILQEVLNREDSAEKEAEEIYADYNKTAFPLYPWRPYQLSSTYSNLYDNGQIVSFYIDFYTYTGGAHGMTERRVFNFDLMTGQELSLSHLFITGYNYKGIIKNYIMEQIKAQPDMYFEETITQKPDNILGDEQSYYLTDDSLIIHFGLYELAPYASGFSEFRIPLKEIAAGLKPGLGFY